MPSQLPLSIRKTNYELIDFAQFSQLREKGATLLKSVVEALGSDRKRGEIIADACCGPGYASPEAAMSVQWSTSWAACCAK